MWSFADGRHYFTFFLPSHSKFCKRKKKNNLEIDIDKFISYYTSLTVPMQTGIWVFLSLQAASTCLNTLLCRSCHSFVLPFNVCTITYYNTAPAQSHILSYCMININLDWEICSMFEIKGCFAYL